MPMPKVRPKGGMRGATSLRIKCRSVIPEQWRLEISGHQVNDDALAFCEICTVGSVKGSPAVRHATGLPG